MTYYYKYQKYKNKYLNFNNMIGGTHIWMFENDDGEYDIINPEISTELEKYYKQTINGTVIDFYDKVAIIGGKKISLDEMAFEQGLGYGITSEKTIKFDIGPLQIIIDGENTHQINMITGTERKIIKRELEDVTPSKVQSQAAVVKLPRPPSSREEGGTVGALLRPVRPLDSTVRELSSRYQDGTFGASSRVRALGGTVGELPLPPSRNQGTFGASFEPSRVTSRVLAQKCLDLAAQLKLPPLRENLIRNPDLAHFRDMGYRLRNPENYHRVYAMIQTEEFLSNPDNVTTLQCTAIDNITRWHNQRRITHKPCQILVLNADWSVATLALTKHFGEIFAVLNMANGTNFGGGYLIGSLAQEEDMFRKTTVVLSKNEGEIVRGKYSETMIRLINAKEGQVYISEEPHICFRDTDDKRFFLLPSEDWFSFYELRAAARDYNPKHNDGIVIPFDSKDCERRIRAQLYTLARRKIRHVVLSAFGCGAFRNPPDKVSDIYKKVIMSDFLTIFDVIVFAIYDPSSKPTGNFRSFKETFKGFKSEELAAAIMDRSLGAAAMDRSLGAATMDRSLGAAALGGLKERLSDASAMGGLKERPFIAATMARSSGASAMGRSSGADAMYDTLVKAIIDFKSIILIDLKNLKKNKHWAWYIFPTYEIGESDERQVYITDEIKERLIRNRDWREIMVQINRVPRDFFPRIDEYRIRSFVDIMRNVKGSLELTEFIHKIDNNYFYF